MEGGEKEDRGKKPMVKKKKRSFLERAIEGILGLGMAYLSGSATSDALRFILFATGLLILIYALYPD
jgi:hypothetical protein